MHPLLASLLIAQVASHPFSVLEVLFIVAIVVLAVFAWKAHHDHLTLKAEYEKDLAAAKDDFASALQDAKMGLGGFANTLEARIKAIEAKFSAPAPTPVSAPVPPATPPAGS